MKPILNDYLAVCKILFFVLQTLYAVNVSIVHPTPTHALAYAHSHSLKYMQFTDVSVHLVDHNTMYFSASELPFTQMPAQVQDNQEGAVPNRRGERVHSGLMQHVCNRCTQMHAICVLSITGYNYYSVFIAFLQTRIVQYMHLYCMTPGPPSQ